MSRPAPRPEPPSGPGAGPRAARAGRRFGAILAAVSVVLCAGAGLWGGIDFLVGVALGCLVVGLNYAWTRHVVRRALLEGALKLRVGLAYTLKFGLTAVALYAAIVEFGVDPLAILIGVSSLVVASLVAALMP